MITSDMILKWILEYQEENRIQVPHELADYIAERLNELGAYIPG